MFVLFLSFLGIFLSFVILRFNPRNRFLAAFYFLNSFYGAFSVALFYFKIPLISVILFVHTFPLFYLLGPSIYFYIRMELTQSSRWKKSDWIHFIPFFLCLILISPYFFQPIEYKYQFVEYFHSFKYLDVERTNILPIGIKHFLGLKSVLLLGYLLYLANWIYKIKRELNYQSNKVVNGGWLTFLISCLLLTNFLITIFTFYSLNSLLHGGIISPYPILIFGSVLGSLLFVSIFFFPNVLYFEVKKQAEPRTLVTPKEFKIQELEQAIRVYIEGNTYLSSDFNKPKIMSDLKISDRLFTFYFNEHLRSSFTQWRSDLRIDYSYELVKNGYLYSHTIESLAQNVGFKSRNKFTEAFRKRIGINPSEVNK